MKLMMIAVALSFFACACSSNPVIDNAPDEYEVDYDCNNGKSVSVRFLPEQGLAVLLRNGDAIELQQQPSGSGFIYSNGPNTIRGKGDDITVEIGRMMPLQCKAR